MTASSMTSNKPYLVRAFYEWIVDNDLTPHVLVDTSMENVVVPEQYVSDHKVTLNVAPRAVLSLNIGNASMMFNARFNGVPMQVEFPVDAILAVYAKENGQGMMFPPVDADINGANISVTGQPEADDTGMREDKPMTPPTHISAAAKKRKPPTLTIVK